MQCSGSGSVSLTGALGLKIVWVCTAEHSEVLSGISQLAQWQSAGHPVDVGSIPTLRTAKLAQWKSNRLIICVTQVQILYFTPTPALGMGTSLGTSPNGTGAIPNRFKSVFFSTPLCWLFGCGHHLVVAIATVKGQRDRNPTQFECVPSCR